MTRGLERVLSDGQDAVSVGDWSKAQQLFSEVLEHDERPEARFGLGVALWWLGDPESSLRCWERSYSLFRRRRDGAQAMYPAVYLCLAYQMSYGNGAAAHGWLGRIARLVEDFNLDSMKGWELFCRAYLATDAGRLQAAESWALEALASAREVGDPSLELCATSELGAVLVETGRVEEGGSLLDEAMAGALAGDGDLDTVVLVGCRTVTSCSRAGDFQRARQWMRAASRFTDHYGSTHLFVTCRMHQGVILFATGEWDKAEDELEAALRLAAGSEPAVYGEVLARLAELRLAQGRVDDAERLLAGFDQPRAAAAAAGIHLARGFPLAATSILRRRLRQLGTPCLESAALVDLLAQVLATEGELDEAASHARELIRQGADQRCRLMVGLGDRALGRALLASGDLPTAMLHLERAFDAFGSLGMPLEVERTRLLIARAMGEGRSESSALEARVAVVAFTELGATRDADEAAAFLRSLGAKPARSGPRGVGLLTKREMAVLALISEGLSNPDIAERLFISRKTVEHHVASILMKLGLKGRTEAAVYAMRYLGKDLTRNR